MKEFVKNAFKSVFTLLLACFLSPIYLLGCCLMTLMSFAKKCIAFSKRKIGEIVSNRSRTEEMTDQAKTSGKKKSFFERRRGNCYRNRFFDFTPVNDIDSKTSFGALDYALNSKNALVHNVAISGAYGAGKSSLWLSYESKRLPKWKIQRFLVGIFDKIWLPCKSKVLKVSLAKFDEHADVSENGKAYSNCVVVNNTNTSTEKEQNANVNACNVNDCGDDDSEKIEFQIEKAILQQILFSVEREDIPFISSYKFSTKTNLFFWLITIAIAVSLSFVIHQYLSQNVIGLFEIRKLERIVGVSFLEWFYWIDSIFISIPIAIYFYQFLKKSENVHVNVFTVKDLSVSFDQENGSLINQNYASIVYFFEQTKKRIVVFEDIDRFASNQIFVKLRELNEILNNCPKLKNKIKFVYMVKENLFSKYQRTKFFDIIVPVVSSVNMDSCADFILNLQNNSNKYPELKNLTRDFIYEFGRFINDNRMVKDFINEFIIYRQQLIDDLKGEVAVNVEQNIFAMIVYKNYYPKDFEDFHRHKGILWRIIQKYKYGQLEESADGVIAEKYNQTARTTSLHDVFDEKTGEDKDCVRWIKWQCLKLKLKISDDKEALSEEDVCRLKQAETNRTESLLFTMLKNRYIGEDCEFYTSRKYLGGLGIDDYKYLMTVKADGKPEFRIDVHKPHLVEHKIMDHQWSFVSVLNYKMVAYELYSWQYDNNPKRNDIVKKLVLAMRKAERSNFAFFEVFVLHLDFMMGNRGFIIDDNDVCVIGNDFINPNLKTILFTAVWENIDENTLSDLFGER
ncbi:hypothetical protein [Fibrobacter sp. UWH1]|uniref:YobI family P-loop NTPase n=1 Tax=Fibrobacter sp. UWH1 TaxID=1964354 RepID=UPI000B5201FD|nr:hypothetical protein [Fibrobacter sp. UWH1]OWV12145.1 hypothetical protein B7992_09770 [Fibrobacter sp. UWH1]